MFAGKYSELTDPFLYCGEIDRRLRHVLESQVGIDAVLKCLGRRGGNRTLTMGDLAFGDYQRCLESEAIWNRIGWPLDRTTFIAGLNTVREIRNRVMHFDREPVSGPDVLTLRAFAKALHELTDSDS